MLTGFPSVWRVGAGRKVQCAVCWVVHIVKAIVACVQSSVFGGLDMFVVRRAADP
jgi:hypothetical protein